MINIYFNSDFNLLIAFDATASTHTECNKSLTKIFLFDKIFYHRNGRSIGKFSKYRHLFLGDFNSVIRGN